MDSKMLYSPCDRSPGNGRVTRKSRYQELCQPRHQKVNKLLPPLVVSIFFSIIPIKPRYTTAVTHLPATLQAMCHVLDYEMQHGAESLDGYGGFGL